MKLTGNTIFITGGGSGIGRGLAEALHTLGNQIIISGRRQGALDIVTAANPGMTSILLDIEDKASIDATVQRLTADYPRLNVLLNNARATTGNSQDGHELHPYVLTLRREPAPCVHCEVRRAFEVNTGE
jgi:uncharacterized oxidoreductase